MSFKGKWTVRLRSRVAGAGITALCGLVFWQFAIGERLVRSSYDLAFRFRPTVDCDDLIILKLDEQSYRETHQKWGTGWDRGLHARLLNKLKQDHSGLVVFDTWPADPQNEAADAAMVEAIKAHGHVVLPAIFSSFANPLTPGKEILWPLTNFLYAAGTNWGLSEVVPDGDLVVRRLYQGTELYPSLAWKAAALAGAPITRDAAQRLEGRWIQHYGRNGTLPSLSYYEAGDQPSGVFQGKTVFIGGKPGTRYPGESVDEFSTPYTRWDQGRQTAGVELNATMFLNLMRGEWLSRMSWQSEGALVLLCGLLLGFGLAQVRPMLATSLAALAIALLGLLAVVFIWQTRTWFCWMVVVGVQVPCALAWSVLTYTKTLSHEKEVLEIQLATSASRVQPIRPVLAAGGTRYAPLIPDHKLLRCIGKGAYGEVWLAVNTVGLYHAVKIVDRSDFKTIEPYTREFKGIEKYMAVSLNHPGLVHILHVGRNEESGYFFYVMEIGDDEVTGARIDPDSYAPRNLAEDLRKRGKLPVAECVALGLDLTDALEFLHQQQLIHRDIKPANIIFVNGVAKLADIGLVTDIGVAGNIPSFVGTLGYIAPEGPGTAAADVYSLGKVLYEAAMGMDRLRYSDLPSSFAERADAVPLMRLNRIILEACETEPSKRYKSAAELRANLLELKRHLEASG